MKHIDWKTFCPQEIDELTFENDISVKRMIFKIKEQMKFHISLDANLLYSADLGVERNSGATKDTNLNFEWTYFFTREKCHLFFNSEQDMLKFILTWVR